MKTYQCHKIVKAQQITHAEKTTDDPLNQTFATEDDELINRDDVTGGHKAVRGDYLVTYEDGYRSISPQAAFEAGYKVIPPGNAALMIIEPCNAMSFSTALFMVNQGYQVANQGWHGMEEFIFLVPGSTFKVNRAPLLGIYPEGTEIKYGGHVDIKTADGVVRPWTPSQDEMLSNEWYVIQTATGAIEPTGAVSQSDEAAA